MIPQIKNTAVCALVIFIGAPVLTAYFQYSVGELHTWAQFGDTLTHASLSSFMMAVGWIFLKSPVSSKITELFSQTTFPSGKTLETKVKITEPSAEDAGEKTAEATETKVP